MNLTDIARTVDQRFGATICPASMLEADRVRGHSITDGHRLLTGWADVDVALGGGLLRGALHEWCGVAALQPTDPNDRNPSDRNPGDRNSGDRGASENGQGRRRDFSQWFAPVGILAHLAGQALRSNPSRWIVWIGRQCFPHPAVLVNHQQSDRVLLARSLFVRADGVKDRLHAIDLALRCLAVEAVVADGSRFDMAATRRIQLLAKAHQKPALLTRPAREQNQLSAAQSRWLVRWRVDSLHRTGCEPKPQWTVELLRCKAMPIANTLRCWTVEWDHATSAVCLSTPLAGAADQTATSTGEAKRPASRKQSA